MGKTLVVTISCMLFISAPAWGQDAMYFLNQGLDNSMANKKIHYFSKALELNPRLAVAYEKRGVLYYFQGKYSEMSEDFLRLAELDPSNSEAHLMLGLAYIKRDEYDRAVESLARAIELNPRLASAYGHRAEAYRLKGMVVEAIQDSTRAIELGDTEQATGRAYTTRAKAYLQLGKTTLADKDIRRSLKLDPSFLFYIHPTMTNYLADYVTDFDHEGSKHIRWLGLLGLLALSCVLIFRFTLPAPHKTDDN